MQTGIKNSLLIINDDEKDAKSIKSALACLENTEIIEAADCLEGMKILEGQLIHVIVTEMRMFEVEEIALISHLSEMKMTMPVILVSADVDKDMALRALRLGVFDIIEKPFSQEVLGSTVTRALEAGSLSLTSRLQNLNLNSTQIKILEMLLKGMSNKEIAEIVNLSEQGVKYHFGNLFEKFQTTNRTELRGKIQDLVG